MDSSPGRRGRLRYRRLTIHPLKWLIKVCCVREPDTEHLMAVQRQFRAIANTLEGGDSEAALALAPGEQRLLFLRYLVERRGFLLHGSRQSGIEELDPRSWVEDMEPHWRLMATESPLKALLSACLDRALTPGVPPDLYLGDYALEGAEGRTWHRFLSACSTHDLANIGHVGWVYALPREGFLHTGLPSVARRLGGDGARNLAACEWTSCREVTPALSLRFSLADVGHLLARHQRWEGMLCALLRYRWRLRKRRRDLDAHAQASAPDTMPTPEKNGFVC